MKKSIKRTKVFVSREIQGRILARMAKYWLLYNFAVWHGLLLIDFERYGVPTLLSGGPGLSLGEFYLEFASQHVILLAVAVALSPFLIWDMLKLTHQIAGPLVRFRNTLNKMTIGEPVEKIELRNGDLLVEFQDAFNAFLESDRLLVGAHPGSGDEGQGDSQAGAVLASVIELRTELNSSGDEPSRAANAAATAASHECPGPGQ
jgi:hypothetical protein